MEIAQRFDLAGSCYIVGSMSTVLFLVVGNCCEAQVGFEGFLVVGGWSGVSGVG